VCVVCGGEQRSKELERLEIAEKPFLHALQQALQEQHCHKHNYALVHAPRHMVEVLQAQGATSPCAATASPRAATATAIAYHTGKHLHGQARTSLARQIPRTSMADNVRKAFFKKLDAEALYPWDGGTHTSARVPRSHASSDSSSDRASSGKHPSADAVASVARRTYASSEVSRASTTPGRWRGLKSTAELKLVQEDDTSKSVPGKRGCPLDDVPQAWAGLARSPAGALISSVVVVLVVLLSAASSILSLLCSSRPPWWTESPEFPGTQTRQRPKPAESWCAGAMDVLLVDYNEFDPL